GPGAGGSCRIRASSCTARIQPVPATIEAVEELVTQGRSMGDAERSVRDGSARGEQRAVASVKGVELALAPDAAQRSLDDGQRDAAIAPRQVLGEATADAYAPVGRVERGKAAAVECFPVVVIDRVRYAVGAGCPHEGAVPEDDARLEVHVDGPAWWTDAVGCRRGQADLPAAAERDVVGPAVRKRGEPSDHPV